MVHRPPIPFPSPSSQLFPPNWGRSGAPYFCSHSRPWRSRRISLFPALGHKQAPAQLRVGITAAIGLAIVGGLGLAVLLLASTSRGHFGPEAAFFSANFHGRMLLHGPRLASCRSGVQVATSRRAYTPVCTPAIEYLTRVRTALGASGSRKSG